MRKTARRGAAMGGVALLVGSLGTAALVRSSDPATGSPVEGATQRSSQDFTDPADGRKISIEDAVLVSGDHRYRYSVDGLEVLEVRDRAECLGRSRGLARVTDLGQGRYRVTGIVSNRTTGLHVTTSDGSEVDVPLVGTGSVTYGFYDLTTSGAPVAFQPSGASDPAGTCEAPS